MLKPSAKQLAVCVTKIIVSIGVAFGSLESSIAREPHRVVAAPTSLSSVNLTDLETAFWVCDYVATSRGTSEISACAAVYEALKDRKFSGDSDALASWWRQNKSIQHRIIALADGANQSAGSTESHDD